MKFGKIENNEVIFAPKVLKNEKYFISNPKKFDYYLFGYSQIIDDNIPTEDRDKFDYVFDGYEESFETIEEERYSKNKNKMLKRITGKIYTAKYKKIEKIKYEENSVKIYDKRKLYNKSKELGVWQQIEEYLKTNELWNDFLFVGDIYSDDPMFIKYKDIIKNLLNLNNTTIDSYLKECEI